MIICTTPLMASEEKSIGVKHLYPSWWIGEICCLEIFKLMVQHNKGLFSYWNKMFLSWQRMQAIIQTSYQCMKFKGDIPKEFFWGWDMAYDFIRIQCHCVGLTSFNDESDLLLKVLHGAEKTPTYTINSKRILLLLFYAFLLFAFKKVINAEINGLV